MNIGEAAAATGVSDQWTRALARQEEASGKLAAGNQAALEAATAAFEQHAASLLRTLDQAHLFLIPLKADRSEFRYHGMFAVAALLYELSWIWRRYEVLV